MRKKEEEALNKEREGGGENPFFDLPKGMKTQLFQERKNVMDGGATDPMRADYQQVQSSMGQIPQQQVGYDYGQPTKMEPLPDLSRFAPTNPYHHQ